MRVEQPAEQPKWLPADIQRVAQNALALHSDARYLLKEHRYRRALALTIFAIEEIGKIAPKAFVAKGNGQNKHKRKQISAYNLMLAKVLVLALDGKLKFTREGQLTAEAKRRKRPRRDKTTSTSTDEGGDRLGTLNRQIRQLIAANAADKKSPVWDDIENLLAVLGPLKQAEYNKIKNDALYEDLEINNKEPRDFQALANTLMKAADIFVEILGNFLRSDLP
jgi:AbiV family abortive infection protein